MKDLQKKWIVILFVLLVALFLRVYHIDTNPPGLTPDEAALSYNAYSILKTGRDEYGAFLPIIFKSFGDYKPGFYVYLDVPFVAFGGLNEITARLPSVFAGVFAVYLIYLIVKEMFESESLSLIVLAVAATNPWLIYFSRGAWEVNVSLALTLAGIYFFLKSLHAKRINLIWSAAFFSLTLITYQGAKLSTLIVLVILGILYWRQVLKMPFKYLISGLIVGLIVAAPIILSLFNGSTGRLAVFNVFSYPRPADYLQNFLSESNVKKGSLVYDLFYNESLNFTRGILGRFFNHFSGNFLFFVGDWANPRHTPPYQGVLVIGDFMFLIFGTIAILGKKANMTKSKLFVILWLILAPLPAILSRDQVHAVRSFQLAVPLIIIIAFGVNYFLAILSRSSRMTKWILVLFVGVIYFATYIYFLDAYFVHNPKLKSQYWEYGYKQMVDDITPIQNNYKQVIVQQSFDQPYIYFLFYTKYDPAKWQKQAKLIQDNNLDVGHVDHLDNICFCAIDWSRDRGDHGDLVVGDISVIPPLDSNDPKEFRLVGEIKYLNGQTAWRILEVR